VPAYALASYVCASRIRAKRHYFSDVAFGAALGIVAGRSVTVGRGDGRFTVAPMAAPGGGGVGFTWIGNKASKRRSAEARPGEVARDEDDNLRRMLPLVTLIPWVTTWLPATGS
jgi:hypothetical protein